jgi:AraC-like DNA-binding protein
MKNTVKIMHEQLGLVSGSPIKIKWCDYDYFKYPWHFHNEYEIVYVIKSSGTRFVGNSIEPFTSGDLVLFGSLLPHMYRNDDIYYAGNPNLRVNAITIQFSKDFFNHAFQYYPEFQKIRGMLDIAKKGIYFEKRKDDIIRKRIEGLLNLSGLDRLLECIQILSLMSKTSHKRVLSSDSIDPDPILYGDSRITKVLNKLNKDYHKPIILSEISEISGMNKSAFCRYFKEKTGKSMMLYINELRIKYACNLLLGGDMSISQICYECGYNNISNFNRHFKKITGFTPSDYIEEFKRDMRPVIALTEYEYT